ncbi:MULTISPECIES: FtsX-like permease family protein [Brevibacterium]|uniref:ABC3 transporter permease C-terminal domain-containing protein n=1 Tax=Brevibacterium metallidurans TaxID=1482676 RepID=A0ABP3C571_9MICO
MIRIALQSAAHHRRSFLATGLVILVGTTLVTAMAGILATGLDAGTVGADRPFLTQFPLIMGTWILAIVIFAVVSTVAVALDNRTEEIIGLRLIGATPEQVRHMTAVETAAISVVAAVPGALLGYLLGGVIVSRVVALGLISPASGFAPGVVLPAAAGLFVVVSGVLGGYLGARAAAHRSPVGAIDIGRARRQSPGIRRGAAVMLIAAGLTASATSLTMDAASVYATAATGPGVVLVSVGTALLAGEILALTNRVLGVVPDRGSAVGHLARINLRAVPQRTRPLVTFLVLFIGVSAGTLSMQAIENEANADSGGIGAVMASINYLVVVLIAAFMAIALANNLVSAINARQQELTDMRLVGATTTQVRGTVLTEGAVAVLASAVCATVVAAIAVVPFAIAKLGTPLAVLDPVPYVSMIAVAAVLTLGIIAVATQAPGRRAESG